MIDEGELRRRFPQIPWDQPVVVRVIPYPGVWCCRYCIAMHGLKASEVTAKGYPNRESALNHIEREHHD